MTLVSTVTERVRTYYPYGSTRYTDPEIQEMVHAADCAIREKTECTHGTVDIPLQANTLWYSLSSDVVRVRSVLYSTDGTTFDDGVLKACSLRDLDSTYRLWTSNRGGTPEHFSVLGTPGVSSCYLLVWMPLTAVSDQTVRVEYSKCYPTNNSAFTALDDIDDKMIDACYVPHVLSQMYAMQSDGNRNFQSYWLEYLAGAERYRSLFASKTISTAPRGCGGMSEGQLL